jgi:hypothetical protein
MIFKMFGSRLSTALFGVLAVSPLGMSACAWGQGAAGTEDPSALAADEPAWVLSLAGGLAQGPSSLPLHVNLGGARAIQLNGTVDLDRGQAVSLSLARQFWGRESDDGERRYPLRLELEGLRADVPRTQLALGVSSEDLADEIDIEGIFANALLRVMQTDHLQGWIGAGVGRIRQSTQDASAVLPGCACLAAAEGDGTVWRAKLRLEWIPQDEQDTDWALFLEGGYSKLPALQSSAGVFPLSTYDKWGLWTLTAGLRLRF